jgi:hypothetical protein
MENGFFRQGEANGKGQADYFGFQKNRGLKRND